MVGSGNSYEMLHLRFGNYYLLAASRVHHVLEKRYILFYTLDVRRCGMDKDQIADDGYKTTFIAVSACWGIVHGNER